MSAPSFKRHPPEEVSSPIFRLPPLESSPDVIKWHLFTWDLMAYVENKPRDIRVACTGCARTWTDHWNIKTGNYKRHFWKHHEAQMLEWKAQAEEAMASGVPKERTILSSNLYKKTKSMQDPEKCSVSSINGPPSKKSRPFLSFDEQAYRLSVLDMVIGKSLSFNLVGSREYHRVATTLRSDAPKLSRYTMQDDLEILYGNSVIQLRSILQNHVGRFALTMDEWNSGNNFDFFAVTLHYLNDDLQLENFTIGFEPLSGHGPHTAEVLYDSFVNILKEYKIEKRIISITRDNASTMCSLVEKFSANDNESNPGLKFSGDITCVGHVMNLAINAFLRYSLFKTSTSIRFQNNMRDMEVRHPHFEKFKRKMKDLPKTVRSIIMGTKQTISLRNTFQALVKSKTSTIGSQVGPEILERDNDIRWLSTFDMIKRFLHFKPEITELLQEAQETGNFDQHKLAATEVHNDQWTVLTDIRDILEIFEEPTLDFQGSTYATICLTIPHIRSVLMELDAVLIKADSDGSLLGERNPYLACGVREAKKKILDYYPLNDKTIKPIETLYLASVLNPRFKLGIFKDLGFSASIIDEIEKHFRAVFKKYKFEYRSRETSPVKGSKRKFYLSSRSIADGGDEVDKYLSESREVRKVDVVKFYQNRRDSFPTIYQMAKDYLAIPATSAPAEALFSQIGNTVTKPRSRMSVDTIKKVAIAKSLRCHTRNQEEPESEEETRPYDQSSTTEDDLDPLLTLDVDENSDEDDYGNDDHENSSTSLSNNPFEN